MLEPDYPEKKAMPPSSGFIVMAIEDLKRRKRKVMKGSNRKRSVNRRERKNKKKRREETPFTHIHDLARPVGKAENSRIHPSLISLNSLLISLHHYCATLIITDY